MTTACGSSTSSPDTPSTREVVKPLTEAPFREYLRILRENGHESDADVSERLYMELLTTPFEDGSAFTEEQVYSTPFFRVHEAAQGIINSVGSKIAAASGQTRFPGRMLAGKDAEKLPPDQIALLARRQAQMVEEEMEKQRLTRNG